MSEKFAKVMLVLCVAAGLSACGDTWRGAKKDTGENMQRTGEAIEDAGEKVED